MSDPTVPDGEILYAHEDGVCVLKLVGDIRYTTGTAARVSRAFDAFLDRLLTDARGERLRHVLVDMSETVSIDSTNLGLLARLVSLDGGPGASEARPVILACRPDITRVLESMGFDRVFRMVGTTDEALPAEETAPTPVNALVGGGTRDTLTVILQAHRRLMAMNTSNARVFADAVALLEAEVKRP